MKKITRFLIALLFLSPALKAQDSYVGAILDYMKVKPGMEGQYLEVEKEWKAIHQERVNEGLIVSWQLWEKMFTSENDPYNYITVAIYSNFKNTESSMPWEWIMENYNEQERDAMMKKTTDSRTMVDTEFLHEVTSVSSSGNTKYIVLNRMNVKDEQNWQYESFENEIFKPIFEEAVKREYRSGWSVWAKWPFEKDEAQYVTVDGYSEYGQWAGGEDLLAKVHPGKTWEEITKRASTLRKHESAEIWRLVDIVSSNE